MEVERSWSTRKVGSESSDSADMRFYEMDGSPTEKEENGALKLVVPRRTKTTELEGSPTCELEGDAIRHSIVEVMYND